MQAAWLVGIIGVTACGGAQTEPVAVPAASPEAAPAAPTPFAWPGLISAKPAEDAPSQLDQFGRLVGVWSCASEQRQPDGTFKPAPGATWTWFYALGGRAVQDIWEPGTGAVGTNLRVYSADDDAWEIQWVTGTLSKFERITAKAVDETVVMHGEAPAGGKFPAHARRITFFDITGDSFEWKYEATKSGGTDNWTEYSRMHCKKTAADPLAR